jgi:hypothetical protein
MRSPASWSMLGLGALRRTQPRRFAVHRPTPKMPHRWSVASSKGVQPAPLIHGIIDICGFLFGGASCRCTQSRRHWSTGPAPASSHHRMSTNIAHGSLCIAMHFMAAHVRGPRLRGKKGCHTLFGRWRLRMQRTYLSVIRVCQLPLVKLCYIFLEKHSDHSHTGPVRVRPKSLTPPNCVASCMPTYLIPVTHAV